MFEQSPAIGPGLGTVTQHTAEILLLLAGAFLLGALLSWLLSRGTALQLKQANIDLARLRERLVAAERRPAPTARLRESNSTEHERTLSQLRESREAEARSRERVIALEGRIALMEADRDTSAPAGARLSEPREAMLPFTAEPDAAASPRPEPKPRGKR